MTVRTRRTVLKGGAALAGVSALGLPSISRAQTDKIKLGHLTPLTGFLGALGEYATLKALGFAPAYVAALILGDSVAIAAIGAAIGIALTFPVGDWFAAQVGTLFPVFEVSGQTVALQIACALGVGVLAAIVPGRRAATVKIVDGLRAIG